VSDCRPRKECKRKRPLFEPGSDDELCEIEAIIEQAIKKEFLAQWRPKIRDLARQVQHLIIERNLRDTDALSHTVRPLLFKMADGVVHCGNIILKKQPGLRDALWSCKHLVNYVDGFSWLSVAMSSLQVRLNNWARKVVSS
jgi:hypothetical protein